MVDHELDQLKREFLVEADEKAGQIAQWLEGSPDSDSMGRVAYVAHQLKGSGGSYGYARISAEAAEIERAAEEVQGNPPAVDPDLRLHVTALREAISSSLRELDEE